MNKDRECVCVRVRVRGRQRYIGTTNLDQSSHCSSLWVWHHLVVVRLVFMFVHISVDLVFA